ncbi:MAG: DegV family protein [Bacillota bacterium]
MCAIKIVTDSTAYLSPAVLEKYDVHVVPLTVHFTDHVMVDGLDQQEEFFERLKKAAQLPTTSQPSPGEFVETYRRLLDDGNEVVAITISSHLSGTYESARSAADMVGEGRVTVIDSRTTSAALAYLVMAAADAAQQGRSRQEIVDLVGTIRDRLRLVFVPDTLEYLRKGGRIGGAQALLGTLLQVKPVLHVREGAIEVLDKVRTRSKAYRRVAEEMGRAGTRLRIGILHILAEENLAELRAAIEEVLPGHEIDVFEAGPVLGTHAGPGTVGVGFYPLD